MYNVNGQIQPSDPVREFKNRLQMLTSCDSNSIEALAEFAKVHYRRARELANVLMDQILKVSNF